MPSLKQRYAGWDEPSEGNDELCREFSFERFLTGDIKLPYRLYEPPRDRIRVPLTIYLHGADVVGQDNENHLRMHDIGTILARPEWQRIRPTVILAPQYGRGMHWGRNEMGEAVIALVRETLQRLPMIDPERIYIYGYSAGGVGTMEILKKAPRLFAGAVVICGATYEDHLEELINTPIWLIHAADDKVVSPERSPGFGVSYLGSRSFYETMKDKMGDRLHYTEYPVGYMKKEYDLNPHCAWVPACKEDEVWRWLFQQRRR